MLTETSAPDSATPALQLTPATALHCAAAQSADCAQQQNRSAMRNDVLLQPSIKAWLNSVGPCLGWPWARHTVQAVGSPSACVCLQALRTGTCTKLPPWMSSSPSLRLCQLVKEERNPHSAPQRLAAKPVVCNMPRTVQASCQPALQPTAQRSRRCWHTWLTSNGCFRSSTHTGVFANQLQHSFVQPKLAVECLTHAVATCDRPSRVWLRCRLPSETCRDCKAFDTVSTL